MRFIKIFLASFFSLIGVVSIILGIMYLVGNFNILIVEPKEIHFEANNYYIDDNFRMTITSSTEDITLKRVTLSLENQDGEAVDGLITDGNIIIPQNVTLDVPFQVKLSAPYSAELGKNWRAGGISVITATSESRHTIDTSCSVFVDVPVERIEIITYSNNSEQTPITSFALGESFYAEAKFYPTSSMYKYSTDEIKKVFFSTNKAGVIAENQAMINAMKDEGKPYIYGYDVLKISNDIAVNAHTFYSAKVEDNYIEMGLSENDLINYVRNPDYGKGFTESLVFTNRTVTSFEISNKSVLNTLTFNNISYIYANSKASDLPNLGIRIIASDSSPLQNKISDVGIRALVRDGGIYREANQNEIIFTESNKVEFAENVSGQGVAKGGSGLYFKNSQGEFVLLSSEISERYSYNGSVYTLSSTGAYYKSGDNYELITETYGATYDKYYLPTVVSANVDNSYWSVITLKESSEYFFEVRLFDKGDVVQASNSILYTHSTASRWLSDNVKTTNLHWKKDNAVELTFIDSADTATKEYAEYKLSDNIKLTNLNATYTAIRYLAFTTNGTTVDQIVQNVESATKYNLSGYNIPYNLFEINGNILKAFGDGTVNVIAVIIKTDYMGTPLLDDSGKYIIFAITKPENATKSYQELVINVNKTVQDLSAEISIEESSYLKNRPAQGSTDLNKIAFVQNQSETPVFTVNIIITADQHTNILNEIDLFVNAWNQDKIYLQAYTLSGVLVKNILYFDIVDIISSENGVPIGTSAWKLPIDVYTLECNEDIELYIKLIYEKLPDRVSNIFLKNVNLPAELNDINIVDNGTYIKIEVYDGKAYEAGFAVETDPENVIEKRINVEQGAMYDVNKYYASGVSSSFVLNGDDITESLLDENGVFIINFYDKYGNKIIIPPADYSVTSSGTNTVINVTNHSSALPLAQLPLQSILYINEVESGQIEKLEFNQGVYSNGAFAQSYTDISYEYAVDNNYIAKITRYGAGGSVIQLFGNGGLLKIEFLDNDGTIYELQNVIEYKITNWQEIYSNYLSLSANNQSITVLKSIGKDIILNIIANTKLGSVVFIELTIKPNISSTCIVQNDIEKNLGASDYEFNKEKYEGIFSDFNVNITIIIEMKLYETINLSYVCIGASTTFLFDNSSTTYPINNTLSISVVLTAHFNYDELGMKKIELRTDSGEFDYKRNVLLNVNPNLKLVNSEENQLEKSIEFSASNTSVPVLETDDIERILGDKNIQASAISMEIISVFEGTQLAQEELFTVSGFNLELNSGAKLKGTYLVTFSVQYGNDIIGQINLTVSTDMKEKTSNPEFYKYFVSYNGKTHLVLNSETIYDFAFIATELFDNVASVGFTSIFLQDVFNVADNKITVANLYSYVSGNYLVLNNPIGEIKYPVLFSPLDIGFISYDIDFATNPGKTESANSDIGYLLNPEYLIENQIADTYNSGTQISIVNVNYSLDEDGTNYSFKNLSVDSVYLLKHLTGANAGYYYIKINGIGVENSVYNFSLDTTSNWTKINDESVNNMISLDFRTPDEKFIGVFNSGSAFNDLTLVEQNKNSGLSLKMFNTASRYSYKIINEINGNINLKYNPTSSDPKYATYDEHTGLLKTESLTEDHIVWLVILKGDNIVAIYRIYIVANSALNIYYPHGNGTGVSSGDNVQTEEAEYVYFKGSGNIIIDFNNKLASSRPNSIYGQDIKRVMFQYGNETIGWTNATNYTLSYSIYKISVDGVETKSTDYNAIQLFNQYLSFDAQNNLTIKNTSKILVIYVKVTAQIDGRELNAIVYYKIVVNYSINNYALKYLDLETDPTGNLVTNETFDSTAIQVDYNGDFNFSDIALVNVSSGTTTVVKNMLKYHIYSAEGKDLTDYINLDIINKTISVYNNVDLVSDLKAHMIMYTMYGTLIDIEITFKSSINMEFNTSQSNVIYNQSTQEYEVYSDIEFDLAEIFTLKNNAGIISVPSNYWLYSFDGGLTFNSGEEIIFDLEQANTYQVTIKILLSDFDNVRYKDDYITTFNLKIKQSVVSNYPNSTSPMNGQAIQYSMEDNGEAKFQGLIYIESSNNEVSALFSVQNLDVLERYTLNMQIIGGNEYIKSYSFDLSTNEFILNLKSPAGSTQILIVFALSQGDYSVTSYLRFTLQPDVFLKVNYPNPNDTTDFTSEYCYLSGEYINGSNNNNVFNSSGGKYAVKFDISETAYFKTTRLVFENILGENINARVRDAERVAITISEITNLVVSLRGTSYLNTNINLDAGALFESEFQFQWVSQSALTTGTTGSVTFQIYVDGLHRGSYVINFCSDIRDIFSIQINPHNQTIDYGSGVVSEVFFVENKNSGKIFSKNEALLSFTLRQNYLNNLNGQTEDWSFYVNSVSENNFIGKFEINSSLANRVLALKGQEEITLENIVVEINGNAYVFNSGGNSIFSNYVVSEGYNLTYRAEAFYRGTLISYEKFAQIIEFKTATGGSDNKANTFAISQNDISGIETPKFIDISVNNVKFATYSYTLVYDFKIDSVSGADKKTTTLVAGTELSDVLDEFAITRYDGSSFSPDYFDRNEGTLFAKVIMITDKDYETTKSTDNLKYLNSEYIGYYKPEYVDIASQFSTFIDYLTLGATQFNEKTYNYKATANGAENEGNYIYVIVTFKTLPTDMAYAVIKFFVKPIWESEFYNSLTGTGEETINGADKPLMVYYDDNSKITTTLSDTSPAGNYINIYKGDYKLKNYAAEGQFNYIVEEELSDYLKLDEGYKTGGFYKNLILITNTTNTAIYGDKSGYIKITDAYGFVLKYYINLVARSDESLGFAGVVNSNYNNLYEGSSLCIIDKNYNQDLEGPIKTDYAIQISNLSNLVQQGFSYKVTYLIDNVLVESYNTDIHSTNYNTGKLTVQKSSFYTTTNKHQPVILKIKLEISKDAYSETIIIPVNINIVQRYSVVGYTGIYVRDAVPFNVSDYVYVRDENSSEDIGEIALSDNQLTLIVPKTLKNAIISVTASYQQDNRFAEITVGKDSSGNNKEDSYDNYYYPLIELSNFKDLDFSQFKFTITSVSFPAETGIYFAQKASYSFNSTGEMLTELSNTDYIFYNSLNSPVSVVYTDGLNYYYKTFAPNIGLTITTTNIVSSWTIAPSFTGGDGPGFVGIYSENLATEYTGTIYNNNNVKMFVDKLLSVATLNLQSDEAVYVVLNNQSYQVSIPFVLNFDGIQSISIYEAILKLYNGNISAVQLQNITKYEKDNQVMSVEDLQKLKGIVLYNDTISLKIAGNMAGTTVRVKVYYNDTDFKTQDCPIANNRPHYYFISINNILGDNLGLNTNGDYKIEIIYTKTNVQSGQETQFLNNVRLVEDFTNNTTYVYDADNQNCEYTIRVNSFEILPLPIINGLYADNIDVLHSGDFVDKVTDNVQKYYLAKYSKDQVVYAVMVDYKVTPQYYSISGENDDDSNNIYKVIYANQYVYDGINDSYKIDFDIWTSGYNLLEKSGKKIKSVTSAMEDLYFAIQTTKDPDEQGEPTGAAKLLSDNSLQTTAGFDSEQQYIKVSVYTYVDKETDQKVFIGNIRIKIDNTSLYVSVPGNYNVTINSPELFGSLFTINTPYTFTSQTAKIDNILNSSNMQSVVQGGKLGFFSGSNYFYRDSKSCTFSVVSVISNIDESVFEEGKLSIKIGLNETQNSIGQIIELKANALPITSLNVSKDSNSFFLSVSYLNGKYYLNYQNQEGEILESFSKGDDGYYDVRVKIEDIFNEIFVGSDYLYNIKIVEMKSGAENNSLSIVYADNSFVAETDQTIFFQISYIQNSVTYCKYVGLKYTEENQRLSGPLGYALDLEELLDESVTLQNCTVSFMGSYDLNCADEGQYNLLLSYGNINYDKTYGIAYVQSYSSTKPFWVEDYGKTMLGFATTLNSVSIYEFDVVNNFPTYLLIEEVEGQNDRYFGVHNVDSLDLFGITPANGYIILNVSAYANDSYKISIKNYSSYVNLNISELFESETEIYTYWQSKMYDTSMLYTRTAITKQSFSLLYDSQSLSLNQYLFEYAPGYWQGGTFTINLIFTDLNLTPIISNLDNDASYFFGMEVQDNLSTNLVIKGNELDNVDITTILNHFLTDFSGTIKLILLNISGVIDEEGLYNFTVFNADDMLALIKTATFGSIAGTNYFFFSDDILANNYRAVKVGNTFEYQLPTAPQMTYYKLTYATNETVYYAVDANQTTNIQIDCSLAQGEIISFVKFEISIPSLSMDSKLYLITPFSQYSQSYTISNQDDYETIKVPATETVYEINLATLGFDSLDLISITPNK